MTQLTLCLLFAMSLLGGLSTVVHAATDTVTLGLPERLLGGNPTMPATLDRLIEDLLGQLPCWRGKGCAKRPQVNIALGTDYEILDWFGKGLLDIAVVPDVGAHLLREEDHLDFVDFPFGTESDARPAAAKPAASRHDVIEIERFAEAIWCAARARAKTRWDATRGLLAAATTTTAAPACEKSDRPDGSYEVQLPSHFHGLAEVIEPAAAWLALRIGPWSCGAAWGTPRAILEDNFWNEFLRHTRFTLGGEPQIRFGARSTPLWTAYSTDRLLVVKSVARRLQVRTKVGRPVVPLPSSVTGLWARWCPESGDNKVRQPPPPAFRSFLLIDPAFAVRTFAFSPGESIELLRRHRTRVTRVVQPVGAEPADRTELALVLPGGGVKAAYQTTLIEHLYHAKLLRNGPSGGAADARDAPLDVDYVIGTSGGALLGYFAARLDGEGPWGLDTILWQWCRKGACREMRSTDVFGYVDMPRYLSAVAISLVFAGVMYFFPLPPPTSSSGAPRRRWRYRLLLMIMPPLLLLPFLIRFVNGDRGREHIPEIEGFVYMLCVLLAMFADQCLILVDDQPDRQSRWRVAGRAFCLIGAVAALGPALLRWTGGATSWLDYVLIAPIDIFGHEPTIQVGALVVCFGGSLLLLGVVMSTTRRAGYRVDNVKGFARGLSVALLHIVLASLVVYWTAVLWPGSLWPGDISLLELTGSYWLALGFASTLVALLLRATWRWGARLPITGFVARGIEYLSSSHPNGGPTARRLVRLTVHAGLAVAWWNLILAPAMYGNELALQFLKATDEEFAKRYPPGDVLKVPLIVTANVLKADGARYFAFLPTPERCLRLTRRSGYGATWRVFLPTTAQERTPPPAPPADCEQTVNPGPEGQAAWTRESLRDIVFASGSPYPVFPAHGVRGEKGRLVDGGYANNVPLDAAQAVGADEVLIVESSNPLGHETLPWPFSQWLGDLQFRGDLFGNLPQLFTFLWERSQELDRISRRELLVVSLAPLREEAEWPNLVEFTSGVIKRMQKVAKSDWTGARRIGMVQSWGRPRFAYTVSAAPSSGEGSKRSR
jgi:predicted acylesterase/phospholipase RssA